MKDEHRTKEQLINELAEMRQRIAELEASEAERKRAEEALRESEERYRILMEEAPIGLCNVDLKGKITYVNKRFEEVSGYSREEVVGKNGFKLGIFSDETLNLLAERIRSRLKGEPARVLEVRFKCKDGRWIWVEIEGRIIKKWGVPVGFQLSSRDVTERKRAEEALQESEEKFRTLAEQSPNMIFINKKGRVVYANARSEEVMGYTKEEFYSPDFDFLTLIAPEYKELVGSSFGKHTGGEEVEPYEYTLITRDGRRIETIITTRLISYEAEKAILGIVTDITDHKRVEEEIRQRTAQLEALREVGLELTAQLDLDTLLRVIVSRAVELLGGNSGALDLYRPECDMLEWAVSVGMDHPSPKPFLRRGEGLCGRVWETGEPLIVDDYHHWEGRRPGWEGYPFKAVMGVPVRWGGEFLGVLEVSAAPPHTFSQADADLLSLFATQAAIAIRNARLYEETRRRALEQETVSRIAYALNTPDVRDAFPVLVEGLRNLTGCDTVNLLVMDETGKQFIISVLESPFPMPGVGDVMPFSATAATEDVESGRPHLTADLSTETHFPLELAFYQAGLRSQVTLPLLVGGEVFGALNLGGSRTGVFQEDQLPVLQQIADAVALALENSLLFQVEREQRELAESLEEAAAVVSSTLDPDQVLDRILEQVSRVVPNDATNIMLIEGEQARVVRWRGYERFGAEEVISTVVFRIADVPGLQQMVESREPMVIPDSTTFPGWIRMPATEWLRSYAAAPIIVRGEVIGFLNVDSVTPGFFTQANAEGLRVFADHAAAAIENARLYEAEQERRHIAETLRQASAVLSSTLELDEVLGLILQQLRQVIPYDSASVQRLQGERLEIVACEGFEEPDKVVVLAFLLDPKFPNYRVVTTRAPLAIKDVIRDYPHFKDEANTYESGRIRSWLGVPLMVKDQVIGMVAMDRTEVRPYTAEEAQLAMAFANQAAVTIENARLFEEEKRRSAQLSLISEVGDKVASILDLDRLIQEVPRCIQEKFNYYNVALFLLGEGRREVVMQSAAGGFEHIFPGQYRQALDEGIIGFVVRSGSSWLANDVSKDPYYVKGFLEEVLTQSELCVPIKLGDKVIGALDVQSIRLNDFDQADVAAMEAVADQVAIAIENARLFEETRQRALQLQTVEEVGRRASSILDLDELLPYVAKTVQQSFGYYHVDIFLVDQVTGYVVFKASNDPVTEKVWKEQDLRFKVGREGMVGWVAHTGEPLLANDVSQEPHYLPDELLPETKSELVVPLKVGERVVGALDVESDKLSAFDETDIFILQTLAGQITIAIENARLYEETQRQSERLAQTLTLSEVLHRGLELEQVLEHIAQGAVRLGFHQAVINVCQPEEDLVRAQAVAGLEGSEREELMGATYRWSDFQILMQERFRVSRSYLIRQGEVDWEKDFQGVVVTPSREDRGPGYWRPEDMLLVPLWGTHGQPVGLLSVDEPMNGLLPDLNTIQTLEAFANQAAIAIENARLFGETERLKAFNESVVQGVAEAILIEDAQGILTFANPAVEELLGYTREELTGLHWSALTPEDEVEKVRQETAKRPQGIVGRYETALLDKKGQRIPVIVSARPLFEEGKFVGVLSAFTDITERKQAEREIEERRMYLEGVLGAAPDAIVTMDASHRVVEWNPGAERLFGYSREETIGRNIDYLITNSDVFEEAIGFTQIVMSGRELPPVETIRYRKDGSPVDVIVAASPILVGDELVGVVAVYTDITERKRMEDALRASLLVDELTGLYNRRGFLTLGQQQLKTADRAKSRMLLLFADFDELKQINDTLGHPEGDLALVEIASALKETFRESDIIARIGGDEFVVLAIETDGASVEILTTRLQENLEVRNARGDRRYKLSLSMGIARYDPESPCSIDELLARADRLMYEQKQDSLEP